jgi:hypothetical protein
MYDVGGQRTKRRKWLSYFDCVRAVLFVVALSDYDMTLTEDRSMVIDSRYHIAEGKGVGAVQSQL